ncbi:hypothetical protein LJR005_000347 [Rossellomorea sp. LjRoot5]
MVAEVGSFKRFSTPRESMAYVGLIPEIGTFEGY